MQTYLSIGIRRSSGARPSGRAIIVLALGLALLSVALPARAGRIKDLCEIQGARGNMLKGVGIVVGLAGTGDKVQAAIIAQQRIMERLGVEVKQFKDLSSANAAIVAVTANIPAFGKEGTRIDVKVDSMYDCESLEGGTLLETYLTGPGLGDTVYAVAQGAVSVGGFNADAGGGTKVRKNHVTAGRIPMGAYIEREVPSTITDGQRLMLLVKQPDFTLASRIQAGINKEVGEGAAMALGAGTVQVTIPDAEQSDLVNFIAKLEEIKVETDIPARVVINERTGTIVVGGDVIIKPCEVAHGNLTIKIATTPVVTPALPFTDANPVVTSITQEEVTEEEAYLMPVEGTSAGDVATALNKLRVTPRDMISIFQALREAGALNVDLDIM